LILLRAWNDLILGWLSSFMTAERDATGGQSLYPLHRCKTLHLVCKNLVLLNYIIGITILIVDGLGFIELMLIELTLKR